MRGGDLLPLLSVKRRREATPAPALPSVRLDGDGRQLTQAKALAGVWVFYFVVWGIILWTAKFPWSLLAFHCASVSLQSAKEVSLFLELRERKLKESFVYTISVKPKMYSRVM